MVTTKLLVKLLASVMAVSASSNDDNQHVSFNDDNHAEFDTFDNYAVFDKVSLNDPEIVSNEIEKKKIDNHKFAEIVCDCIDKIFGFLTPFEIFNLASTNKEIYSKFEIQFSQAQNEYEAVMKNFPKDNRFDMSEFVKNFSFLKSLYFVGKRDGNFSDHTSQWMKFTISGEESNYVLGLNPHSESILNIWRLDINDNSIKFVREKASYCGKDSFTSFGEVTREFTMEEVQSLIMKIESNVAPFEPQFTGIMLQMKEQYGEHCFSNDDMVWQEYIGLQKEILQDRLVPFDYTSKLPLTQNRDVKRKLQRLLNQKNADANETGSFLGNCHNQ